MLFFSRVHQVCLIIISIILPVFLCGCQAESSKVKSEDERVVARVDDYKIIVSDFAVAVSRIAGYGEVRFGIPEAKEKTLDDLITRAVLIQEAQKQNLDKQKVFIKEIEKYWTQALVKFVLNKKSEELSRVIYVEESEVENEYRLRQRKFLAEFAVLNDEGAAKRLSQEFDKFNEIKKDLKDKVVSAEPVQWWEVGDLPIYLEDYLFSLRPAEISKPIKYGDNWVVIRVLEVGVAEIAPFEEIALQLKREIVRRKREKALERWIENLKKKADVEINYEVLEGIDLEKLCGIN
ncbi:MAG: peptidyl-prolyl cis-trans isomerase [Candidatus Omnitrophota bacterium]|nr:MAG: peptidyl-prolyl cis-trans isomerase [Candidatus Omnitrophota bacterium]